MFNRFRFGQYEVMVEFRQYPRTPDGRSSKTVRLAVFSLLLSYGDLGGRYFVEPGHAAWAHCWVRHEP